jgi:hypothetical protein
MDHLHPSGNPPPCPCIQLIQVSPPSQNLKNNMYEFQIVLGFYEHVYSGVQDHN